MRAHAHTYTCTESPDAHFNSARNWEVGVRIEEHDSGFHPQQGHLRRQSVEMGMFKPHFRSGVILSGRSLGVYGTAFKLSNKERKMRGKDRSGQVCSFPVTNNRSVGGRGEGKQGDAVTCTEPWSGRLAALRLLNSPHNPQANTQFLLHSRNTAGVLVNDFIFSPWEGGRDKSLNSRPP